MHSTSTFGTLVGGVGFRLRLYHRVGLGAAQIARVIALAIVTNWSGWFLLTGSVFAARQVPLPESFTFGAGALQVIGVAMLALPLAYRGALLSLAPPQIALAKPRVHVAERAHGARADRPLDAQLAADRNHRLAADAARARVRDRRRDPAQRCHARRADAYSGGLGVLEGIFVAALGRTVETSGLIAALIAYRALYYLIPLAIASAAYFFSRRRHGAHGRSIVRLYDSSRLNARRFGR
jgi:hypothetical protein